ncbi:MULTISPECIES: hypothetical protein, partial [unclassified Sulfitobacter]
ISTASTIRADGIQHWVGKAPSPSNGKWPKRALGAAQKRDRSKWSCYVQLKSTAQKKGRTVKAKLSTFEPFAKLPGPSLLVVFRLHTDGEPKRGYVIPIFGKNLARVLLRLRQAESKRDFDLASKNISFDYRSKGHEFQLTAEGLRDALQKAVGDDPTAYVAEKQRQLRELGYEDAELVGQYTFKVDKEGQLARIWLGLEPINASGLSVFDARFGIPIPYSGQLFDDLDQIKMTPPSVGVWRVSMKGPDVLDEAAVFEVEAHVAPPELGGPIALLKHQDFTIVIEKDGLQFETEHVFGNALRPLDRWCTLLRGLGPVALLCRPKCSFRPLSVRRRRGFSNPVLNAVGADCRSR